MNIFLPFSRPHEPSPVSLSRVNIGRDNTQFLLQIPRVEDIKMRAKC
jgi:hypothetical protein